MYRQDLKDRNASELPSLRSCSAFTVAVSFPRCLFHTPRMRKMPQGRVILPPKRESISSAIKLQRYVLRREDPLWWKSPGCSQLLGPRFILCCIPALTAGVLYMLDSLHTQLAPIRLSFSLRICPRSNLRNTDSSRSPSPSTASALALRAGIAHGFRSLAMK
jgi:hypothetical protein